MDIHTVNIKFDMPTASQAATRLTAALATGKQMGALAVKIIHGYGSGGQGGRIRTLVRSELAQRQRKGQIRGYIPGEAFTIFNEDVLKSFALCPALRRDPDLDNHNNGVTIVLL